MDPKGGASWGRRGLAVSVYLGIALCILSISPRSSQAQQLHLNQYRPAELAQDGFAISRPDDQGHLRFGMQLQLDYANDPLVLEVVSGDTDSESFAIVSDQLVGHVNFALGLVDRLVLYAGLPVNLYMEGDEDFAGLSSDGAGLGDAYFGARLRIVGDSDDIFGLAIQGTVTAPTADAADGDQSFAGESGVTGQPELLFELRPAGVRITGNVGVRVRSDEQFTGVSVGHELTYGLGLTVPFIKGDVRLDGHLEVYGTSTFEDFAGRQESPLEGIAGLKVHSKRGFTAGLAAGPGLQRGVGSPDVRAVAMFGWTHTSAEPEPEPEPSDRDGDGLLDEQDRCPDEPEDADSFEDQDGCPDPDNDQDGVLDVDDGAPLEPEDHDEFEDEDGVPDPDNDQDGVADTEDQCPNEPGLADNQGCLDPDRDGDGVVDRLDNCPDEPGTVENQGCQEKQQVVIREGSLEILDKVYFRTNRDKIQKRSHELLMNVAQVLNNHPEITSVRVEGHTDARGNHEYNVKLSTKRAEAVVKFLTERGEVEASRLEAVGYGPDRPVVENASTKEEHAQNRRVEFNLVQGDSADAPSE